MLPQFSPVETPALKQAVAYAHKTQAAASALIFPALEATAVVTKLKKALRALTGPELAAERKALRATLQQAESMAIKLNALLTQAQAIYERAWAKRCAILDAQRIEWEQANPEAAHELAVARMHHTEYHAKSRVTHRNRMRRHALMA